MYAVKVETNTVWLQQGVIGVLIVVSIGCCENPKEEHLTWPHWWGGGEHFQGKLDRGRE